jgi:2-keto-3-deoxy-L-rhamnonate aldolase RhmA
MKTPAIQKLRDKLRADQPTYGLWITLESASIAEMAVALGLDWIVIDAEHGHLDWREILEHVRATVRSDTVALVRIAESSVGLVKRALDIGADGVVVPWIETADQLLQAKRYALYPLEGVRGIGAERATGWGESLVTHAREANDNVLVVPVIETTTARKNIDAICAVPGIDLFFLGPADYSSTAGYRGQWEGPGVAKELLSIEQTIRAAGKACGILTAGTADLLARREQGFRLLGLGIDANLLLRGVHAALAAVGKDQRIHPTLTSGFSSHD